MRPRESFEGPRGPLPTLFNPRFCPTIGVHLIEHYEIATYGTLCTWAELLGYKNAKKNLGANHGEEEKCDQKLTKLSKAINLAAK